jgi:hypothetical protein
MLYPVVLIAICKVGGLTLEQEVQAVQVAVGVALAHIAYIITTLSWQVNTLLGRNFWFISNEVKRD